MRTTLRPPRDDLRFSYTTGILQKKKTMWFIGVEVEQKTRAPPPKKNLDPPLVHAAISTLLLILHVCPHS